MSPKRFKGLLVDMDGVLWRGDKPIPENIEPLKEWNIEKVYITNNSMLSREDFLNRINALGLNASLKHVIPTSYATALWLKRKNIKNVFAIGESGLLTELEGMGIDFETDPDTVLKKGFKPEAVAVGLDRNVDYKKIWAAQTAIIRGAIFVATNTDASYPLESGEAPGAGAIVAAISKATGINPHTVIGKPSPPIFEMALEILKLKPEEALVIGDRWETDILGARNLHIPALIIQTGVTSNPQDIHHYPDVMVSRDIKTWLEQHEEV